MTEYVCVECKLNFENVDKARDHTDKSGHVGFTSIKEEPEKVSE